MRRQRTQPVRADVLAFWRTRFVELRQKLDESPKSGQAWFWQVQWDILNYLLHRYAGDKMQTPPAPVEPTLPASTTSVEFPKMPDPAPLDFKPSESFAVPIGDGKMPRVSNAIRPVLQDIAQTNKQRYQFVERLHDEAIAATREEYARIRAEMERLAPGFVPQADISIDEPEPTLTHDEIVEILSNMLTDEAPPGELFDPGEQKPTEENKN